MADHVYNHFKDLVVTAADDWTNWTTIKALLVDSSSTYVPVDTHHFLSDAQAAAGWAELATTGYTAGGNAVAGRSTSENDASSFVQFLASNVTWAGLGPAGGGKTVKAVVLYHDTGVASTSELIAYLDSGGSLALNGGNVTLQWGANGVLTLS